MFYVAKSSRFVGWRRGVAASALLGALLVALPPAPAGASRFFGSSRTFGSFGSGFRSSHFGITFGGSHFRVNFGTSRFSGFRPFYGSRFTSYPYFLTYPFYGYPYYTGLYPYASPYLSIYTPFYAYSAPQPRTIYVYPPPIVRTYPETETTPREETRSRPLHPYDEPVSPSPEKGSVDEALAHIRDAWLTADVAPLEPHLPAKGEIALYRDGKLRQELSADEFLRLNREAFRQIRTVSFRFTDVRHPAADEATATAIHTYVAKADDNGETQTTTLRYDVVRRDDVWTLRDVRVLGEE